MRAPGFWSRPSPAADLLAPAAALWALLADRRMDRPCDPAPAPALCVGNFTFGGAGKTPVVDLVCRRLEAIGRKPFVLSRGYGGTLSATTPRRVEAARHRAREVGDEPLMLALRHPVVIGRDRSTSATLALADGADALILDDGFQSRAFACPALIVVDGASGLGNERVAPAGPLRASLETQWRHSSALMVLGEGEGGRQAMRRAVDRGLPVFTGRLAPDDAAARAFRDRPIFAFAGIGTPDKFFRTLDAIGARIVGRRAFPDHRPYRESDVRSLAAQAATLGAELATTEKDMMRLRDLESVRSGAVSVRILPVRAEPADAAAFDAWLRVTLAAQPTYR